MTAKQYFDFKCDYLEEKYGHISLPLIKQVYYEAERKFGSFEKHEVARTLDDIIAEKAEPNPDDDEKMTVSHLFLDDER